MTFYRTTPPAFGGSVFYGCSGLTTIHVPAGTADAYRTASGLDIGWLERIDQTVTYTALGAATFTLAQQTTPIRFEVYIGGAGAGGGGWRGWGSQDVPGGSGSGGAAIKLVFTKTTAVDFSMIVGKGGDGAGGVDGNSGASPGGTGGASSIIIDGVTFTAGGGTGCQGEASTGHYPGPGGTCSPSTPPSGIAMTSVNGGTGSGSWTPAGVGGAIDDFKAGNGGEGAHRTKYNGSGGENGSIRIHYYEYLED
jgi:hypothetical protein